MKNLMALVAVTFILAACASTPKSEAPAQAEAKGPTQAQLDAQKLADELNSLKSKSVYFDFDKSVVKSEYQGVVKQQTAFISAHGNDVVTLEGNCDERGSQEYNLALGQRRADAVRKQLETEGVKASQIKTVSFGEEKPRLTCHAEKCWKENRRVDFDHKISQ